MKYQHLYPSIKNIVQNNNLPLEEAASLIAASLNIPIITTCEILLDIYGENAILREKIVFLKDFYKV